jgi:uncharacterized protein (DUF779 family)
MMATPGAKGIEPAVVATPAALAAIAWVAERRGPVMLYQSGGCCDGSLPICFQDGELLLGAGDVLLGLVGACPVYIDGRQWERWKHTQLIIDVAEGEPEGFSLPAGPDKHFVTRSKVCSPPSLRGELRKQPP